MDNKKDEDFIEKNFLMLDPQKRFVWLSPRQKCNNLRRSKNNDVNLMEEIYYNLPSNKRISIFVLPKKEHNYRVPRYTVMDVPLKRVADNEEDLIKSKYEMTEHIRNKILDFVQEE